MTERDYLYDNIKGILIILVVLCHFLGYAMIKSDTVVRSFIIFIYYFHMPLFIFISGYFSKNPDRARDTAFRNLFMVYIVAQVFWIIFKYLTNGSTHYIEHFLDPGYAIWYIVSLFFWRLFLKDLLKIRYILVLSFIAAPLIMFLSNAEMTLAINKTIGFLFFFLLGYYTRQEHIAKIRRFPQWAAFLLLLAIWGGTWLLMTKGILPYGGTKAVLMRTANMSDYANPLYGMAAYYLSVIPAMLCGVLLIAASPGKKTFLADIGGDTLPLYLSHTYFLILCGLLFDAVSISHGMKYAIVITLSAVLIALFSTKIYRRGFHAVYQFFIGWIYPKSKQKKSINNEA
ncbi:MAG: acyltransferase family protein [Clostridia bacterium]